MNRIAFIFFMMTIHISITGYSQTYNVLPTKEFKLKKTDYKIVLPRKFGIEFTNGIDFLGYSINNNIKDLINEPHIWIYLGYYPKSMSESSNYTLTKSINVIILNDTVTFKIFKSNEDFLIEGFIFDKHHSIQTQIFLDKQLQLYMFGKAKYYNDIDAIIQILKTIKLYNKNTSS